MSEKSLANFEECNIADAFNQGLWKQVEARPTDRLEIQFSRNLDDPSSDFLGFVAIVTLADNGTRRLPVLDLRFEVDDPRLDHFTRTFCEEVESCGRRGVTLTAVFTSGDSSYAELIEPIIQGSSGRLRQVIRPRITVEIVGANKYFDETFNGAVYVCGRQPIGGLDPRTWFDCHAHHYLSPRFETKCHGTGTCVTPAFCGCVSWDLSTNGTCWGMRACFCDR